MTYQERQELLAKMAANCAAGEAGNQLAPVSANHCSRKSVGHLCFAGDFEYYHRADEHGNHQVFRAARSNAFDLDGYRHGRWESSLIHWGSRA